MSGDADEIVLEIEGTPITCKRQELTENSDYFKAMLEGNFVERSKKNIKLEAVDLKSMNIILSLLWDESFIIEGEDLLLVLQTSCMLQFIRIKENCIERVTEILAPENCVKIWQITEQLDIKPLNLKAKSIALIEFNEIKNSDALMELNLKELKNYLGSKHLQCNSEFEVFQTIIKWWYENSAQYDNSNNTKILLQLFSCIAFKSVANSELNEIKTYPDIRDDNEIQDVLNCIYDIKNNSSPITNFNEECLSVSKKLLQTEERIFLEYPCIVVDNLVLENGGKKSKCRINVIDEINTQSRDILCYDKYKRKRFYKILDSYVKDFGLSGLFFNNETQDFMKFLEIDHNRCLKLDGFKLIGYKEFVFMYGGEFLLGKGNWNVNFWVYDSIRERWERKCVLPFPRRHFESCINGTFLYIIGGTGPFRVIQENMFWYNYKQDLWSREIMLPCPGRQLKCCNFKNQLFLLNINNKCGYFFDQKTSTWLKIDICDSEISIPDFTEKFAIFSHGDSLFIKGNSLIELRKESSKLIVKVIKPVENLIPYEDIEAVLCNSVVYTTYKHRTDEDEKSQISLSFETYDLKTHQVSNFFEKTPVDAMIDVNGKQYLLRSALKLFKFHHYSSVEENKLINSTSFD